MRYFTLREIADLLSVAPGTVGGWYKQGKLIGLKRHVKGHRNKMIMIAEESLRDYLQEKAPHSPESILDTLLSYKERQDTRYYLLQKQIAAELTAEGSPVLTDEERWLAQSAERTTYHRLERARTWRVQRGTRIVTSPATRTAIQHLRDQCLQSILSELNVMDLRNRYAMEQGKLVARQSGNAIHPRCAPYARAGFLAAPDFTGVEEGSLGA